MNPEEITLCPSRRCAAGQWEAGGALTVEEAAERRAQLPPPALALASAPLQHFRSVPYSGAGPCSQLHHHGQSGCFLCALLVSRGVGLCLPGDT